jgi:hypothetical protein
MHKHTIHLATRAELAYGRLTQLARESSPESSAGIVLQIVDRLIDTVIANDPLGQNRLGNPFPSMYWVSEGSVQIYYTLQPKSDLIVITRISTAARPVSSMQKADAIMRYMVASGELKASVLEAGAKLTRVAAAGVN